MKDRQQEVVEAVIAVRVFEDPSKSTFFYSLGCRIDLLMELKEKSEYNMIQFSGEKRYVKRDLQDCRECRGKQ